MRVLLASDHYPPFIGGAHVQTRLIAHELAARGHAVAVATPWHRGLPALAQEGDVLVHRLRQLRTVAARLVRPGVQQHQPPFADPVTVVALRRVIREFEPDVIHSHGWFGYSSAAALTGLSIPLVVSSRDYGYACPKRTLLHDGELCSGPAVRKCGACAGAHYGRAKGWGATAGVLGSRPLLRSRTTGIHTVSTFVRDIVRRDFLDGSGAHVAESVVPEAVPEAKPPSEPVAEELRRLPDEPFILFVGALRQEKGIPELLAAYERLLDPPPLVLIGTIEVDTPREFPPGALVLTNFTHEAVLHAWDRSLFGVFPSVLPEPMGTVLCEAATRGKAVIGTRPGGHVDVIEDGVSGLLVDAGDIEGLARTMQRLLDDDNLRQRLGHAAASTSERFRVETVVSQLERLYGEVCRTAG